MFVFERPLSADLRSGFVGKGGRALCLVDRGGRTQGTKHVFEILHEAFVFQCPFGVAHHLHHLVLKDLTATSLVSVLPLLLDPGRAGWSFAHDEGHVEVQQLVGLGALFAKGGQFVGVPSPSLLQRLFFFLVSFFVRSLRCFFQQSQEMRHLMFLVGPLLVQRRLLSLEMSSDGS